MSDKAEYALNRLENLAWEDADDARRMAEIIRNELAGMKAKARPVGRCEQHPDDHAVDLFAAAMKAKMAQAREGGRSGWDDPEQCKIEHLSSCLSEHLVKNNAGNYVDVANYCMMLHRRGAHPSLLPTAITRMVRETFEQCLDQVVPSS